MTTLETARTTIGIIIILITFALIPATIVFKTVSWQIFLALEVVLFISFVIVMPKED